MLYNHCKALLCQPLSSAEVVRAEARPNQHGGKPHNGHNTQQRRTREAAVVLTKFPASNDPTDQPARAARHYNAKWLGRHNL